MRMISGILKSLVAALTLAAPVSAQGVVLDDLFTALKQASPPDSEQIVQKIWREWSKSGSPAMDLLLERARRAMEVGDNARAIEHLGALIDHAPDFAEAYNTRATAYYNEGRFGLALDDIRMALALNPRHFGAMTGLAIILDDLGREEEALHAWREVERLYPQQESLASSIERLSRKVEGTGI